MGAYTALNVDTRKAGLPAVINTQATTPSKKPEMLYTFLVDKDGNRASPSELLSVSGQYRIQPEYFGFAAKQVLGTDGSPLRNLDGTNVFEITDVKVGPHGNLVTACSDGKKLSQLEAGQRINIKLGVNGQCPSFKAPFVAGGVFMAP